MKALVPCHSLTSKSWSKSSVIVYQGMWFHPWRSFRRPISAWGGAGGEGERRVPCVQVPRVRHLIRHEGAAHAGPLRVRAALGVRRHLGSVEGAVDDQLAAPLEQAGEAHAAARALEPVLLVDR